MAAPGHSIVNNPDSAEYAAEITPSDSTVLSPTPRGLYVGTTGDLEVTMAGDEADVTFKSVPAGAVLAVRVTKVKAATSASNIVALY